MRLFLYGTLQPSAGTQMARWLAERIVEAQPASAPGRLFAIPTSDGWYPALLPGAGPCHGTLVRADLSRPEMARLDRYEGVEYRRSALRVRTAGAIVTGSGYLWRGRLPAQAVPLGQGDFLQWLARSGRRSYGSGARDRRGHSVPPIDPRPADCHRAGLMPEQMP